MAPQAFLLFLLCFVQILAQITLDASSKNTKKTDSNQYQSEISNQNLSFFKVFAEDQCLIPDPPQKLGITCVTRLRINSDEDIPEAVGFFKGFLNRYAEMDCQAFDNIYFIWNNPKAPEEYPGLLERKPFWKKNVFFLQTINNGLDHRWALPPWAPEQAFYSLDDDVDIDCSNIERSFLQWKEHFIAGIGPIASPQVSARLYGYNLSIDRFTYTTNTPKSYFSFALPNVGIVPRHFADLYYAPFPQFEKMRQTVIEMINCDDICLNFMVGYVYPEIKPLLLGNVSASLLSSKVQLNKSPLHYSNRTEAMNRFSNILGENTLALTKTHRNQEQERAKTNPTRRHECMLALKRSVMEQKYLSYNHYYNFMKGVFYENSTEIDPSVLKEIKKDQYIFSLSKEDRVEMNRTGKIDLSYKPKYKFDDGFGPINASAIQHREEMKTIGELKRQNQELRMALVISLIILVLMFGFWCFQGCQWKKVRNENQKLAKSDDLQMVESNEIAKN